MTKININIEAYSMEEYQEAVKTLATGLGDIGDTSSIKVKLEPIQKPENKIEPQKKLLKKEKASTDSISDTEPSKTGEQVKSSKDSEITQEKATKTRYFLHKPNNKTFVVKKGEGIPVEAVHYGDAVEMTKAEYDKFNKKHEVDSKEEKSVTREDCKALMMEAQKVKKLSLVSDLLTRFEAVNNSGKPAISELKEEHFSNFADELEKLLRG